MENLGPAPEELSNDQIIQQYAKEINQIIDAGVDMQFDFERQVLINQARKNIMMVQGSHYNVPGAVDNGYGEMIAYLPFENIYDEEEKGADVRLCPPINKIGGNCYKFMAVMGATSPAVKAVADDSNDPDSVEVARNADVQVRDIWRKQKINRKWKIPSFHQYTTGPCFARSFWNTNRKKYGSTTEPVIEIHVDETGTPMPIQTGSTEYDNGDSEYRFYSILDVTISPFDAETLEEVDRLMLDRQVSKWALLDQYKSENDEPGVLDAFRITDPPSDDAPAGTVAANEAREAVSNPSLTGRNKRPNTWRHHEYWCKAFLYECLSDPATRNLFYKHFPDGLFVAKVESIICKIDNLDKEDEWSVCKVGRSERIYERPLCADAVALNLAMNDLFGLALETALRAIPQTLVDGTLIDRNKMSTKDSVPGELIFTSVPVDGNMNNKVVELPVAHLSDQVLPLFDKGSTLIDDITGVRPEIAGGGPPTTTFREAQQRKNQALQQLAPQSNEQRWLAEDLGFKLVRLRGKYGSGTTRATKRDAKNETELGDIQMLRQEGWHCESDDNWPMNLADRRDAMFSILKEFPPEIQAALCITDPMNIEQIFDLLQVPGFQSKMRDQVEKSQADIQKLLLEAPVPSQAPPTPGGPPPPMESSIPPDPFDNHVIVAGTFAAWLISQAGRDAANQNPRGHANVVARWQAEQQLATPPPPPPPPLVHTGLNVTAKLEDMPQLTGKIMQGAGLGDAPAGLPGMPPPPPPAAPPAGTVGEAPPMKSPMEKIPPIKPDMHMQPSVSPM